MKPLVTHIEEKAGIPGLADLLLSRLSASELNTLLLECNAPGGMEFRNYWFKPVVDAMERFGRAAKAGKL